MKEFYTNHFARKLSVLDALRESQLWALNHPDEILRSPSKTNRAGITIPDTEATAGTDSENRLSPKYWAPFVLSGDWR